MHNRYGDQLAPLAIGHLCGAGLAAENTLAGFARSYALRVRYLETDVRLIRDGEVVAFHDSTLRRLTGHRGTIGSLRLAELRSLRMLDDGPIPTLTEVLAAFDAA